MPRCWTRSCPPASGAWVALPLLLALELDRTQVQMGAWPGHSPRWCRSSILKEGVDIHMLRREWSTPPFHMRTRLSPGLEGVDDGRPLRGGDQPFHFEGWGQLPGRPHGPKALSAPARTSRTSKPQRGDPDEPCEAFLGLGQNAVHGGPSATSHFQPGFGQRSAAGRRSPAAAWPWRGRGLDTETTLQAEHRRQGNPRTVALPNQWANAAPRPFSGRSIDGVQTPPASASTPPGTSRGPHRIGPSGPKPVPRAGPCPRAPDGSRCPEARRHHDVDSVGPKRMKRSHHLEPGHAAASRRRSTEI